MTGPPLPPDWLLPPSPAPSPEPLVEATLAPGQDGSEAAQEPVLEAQLEVDDESPPLEPKSHARAILTRRFPPFTLVEDFIAQVDPPEEWLIEGLIRRGGTHAFHGEPRGKKSLAAEEVAIAGATGRPAFGLFPVPHPFHVDWCQVEDPTHETRKRTRALLGLDAARLGGRLRVQTHRINLDNPLHVGELIADMLANGTELLILDAARRLTGKIDEGPSKARDFSDVVLRIRDSTRAAILIVHHDVKPARDGRDSRRKGHLASGGDVFAIAESPFHVEYLSERESLVVPGDLKFSATARAFRFRLQIQDHQVTALLGEFEGSPHVDDHTRKIILDALSKGPRTGMSTSGVAKVSGIHWRTVAPALESLALSGELCVSIGLRGAKMWINNSRNIPE